MNVIHFTNHYKQSSSEILTGYGFMIGSKEEGSGFGIPEQAKRLGDAKLAELVSIGIATKEDVVTVFKK